MAPRNLLVVEPNPTIREVLVMLLEDELRNLEVGQADNFFSAMQAARALRPDLILLDLNLPGFDGCILARQLRNDPVTRSIPLIALSSPESLGDRERARAAGCNAYVAARLFDRGHSVGPVVRLVRQSLEHSVWRDQAAAV
jgi:two-component system cell cycle response regulator DivK